MDEFDNSWNAAHDQGRADTREVLRSGRMSHDYAVKLVKGSFGLTFWFTIATCFWLLFSAHWKLWSAALVFFLGWPISALVWAATQTAAIMLIWRARGVGPTNSD